MVHKTAPPMGFLPEMMPMMFYADWYKNDVSPHLSIAQKKKLLKKISDISLERPIFEPNIEFDKKDFPELAPFIHTKRLTGLQLYAVMQETFGELLGKKAKWFKKTYPQFPSKKV